MIVMACLRLEQPARVDETFTWIPEHGDILKSVSGKGRIAPSEALNRMLNRLPAHYEVIREAPPLQFDMTQVIPGRSEALSWSSLKQGGAWGHTDIRVLPVSVRKFVFTEKLSPVEADRRLREENEELPLSSLQVLKLLAEGGLDSEEPKVSMVFPREYVVTPSGRRCLQILLEKQFRPASLGQEEDRFVTAVSIGVCSPDYGRHHAIMWLARP